ncbi:unnamed protein product, partial [Onchocerca ochengi]|uniref:Laminin EGF-like domain-containing protein n=1 Tax=Onchocerca ochengi TaxID=42157 RepID=A0A182ESZ6_ONCOC
MTCLIQTLSVSKSTNQQLNYKMGNDCKYWQPGYFNLTSGSGCQECNCDVLGSVNSTCDVLTGQCLCKSGVMGR